MKQAWVYLLISLFCFVHCMWAQTALDSMLARYSFIQSDSNLIRNDSVALYSFFEKLYQLQNTSSGTVNIAHIGDSHIQADHFSGTLRYRFQNDYGNAGRGLVFPYRVAKTNEPSTYRTTTNTQWVAKRNVFPNQPLPIGISGVTIETSDTSAAITLTVKNQEPLDYSFNKLTLFHAKDESGFDFAVYDTLNNELAYISTEAGRDKFTSEALFKTPVNKIILKACPRTVSQSCAQVYGMLLENGKPGVLYHMIGVNGAEYRHYSASEYFMDQLSLLKPDLIILSMGTNEGFNKGFDKTRFYNQVDSLIKSIRVAHPGTGIILTTPGDSFRRSRKGKVKNPDILEARNTLLEYGRNNQLACWDLFSVMGGYGSMAKWFSSGLTSKDKLHFNRKGYELQGALMYRAIQGSYKRYLKGKKIKN